MQGRLCKEKLSAKSMVEELGRKEGSLHRVTEALLQVSHPNSPPLKVSACFVHVRCGTCSNRRFDFDVLINKIIRLHKKILTKRQALYSFHDLTR